MEIYTVIVNKREWRDKFPRAQEKDQCLHLNLSCPKKNFRHHMQIHQNKEGKLYWWGVLMMVQSKWSRFFQSCSCELFSFTFYCCYELSSKTWLFKTTFMTTWPKRYCKRGAFMSFLHIAFTMHLFLCLYIYSIFMC
jgi:hypothetical protein